MVQVDIIKAGYRYSTPYDRNIPPACNACVIIRMLLMLSNLQ
jgi:hypothetical protein